MKKFPKFIYVGGLLVGMVAYGFLFREHKMEKSQSPGLVQVGAAIISERDLKFRELITQFEYPSYQPSGNPRDSAALKQLIRAHKYAAILAKFGRPVTPEILENEARRIDRETKNPERLTFMKSIFGRDRESYLRNFVFPLYVEREIAYSLFPYDSKIHRRERHEAGTFLNDAKVQPKRFREIARKRHLKVSRVEVSRAKGLRFADEKGVIEAEPQKSGHEAAAIRFDPDSIIRERALIEAHMWLNEILEEVQAGQMVKKVIERPEEFWVAHLVSKKGRDQAMLEFVSFPKRDFSRWAEAEGAQVNLVWL